MQEFVLQYIYCAVYKPLRYAAVSFPLITITKTKLTDLSRTIILRYCGYLATLSALASGADNAYIYEEKFNVTDIVVGFHIPSGLILECNFLQTPFVQQNSDIFRRM